MSLPIDLFQPFFVIVFRFNIIEKIREILFTYKSIIYWHFHLEIFFKANIKNDQFFDNRNLK